MVSGRRFSLHEQTSQTDSVGTLCVVFVCIWQFCTLLLEKVSALAILLLYPFEIHVSAFAWGLSNFAFAVPTNCPMLSSVVSIFEYCAGVLWSEPVQPVVSRLMVRLSSSCDSFSFSDSGYTWFDSALGVDVPLSILYDVLCSWDACESISILFPSCVVSHSCVFLIADVAVAGWRRTRIGDDIQPHCAPTACCGCVELVCFKHFHWS